MRTSILLAAWASVALLLPAPATGQDALPTDKPYIFFSASPNVSGDAAPDKPLRKLNLRPNQDSSYFVYVHNPLKDKASVKVQLVSGPAGKLVVAAEKTVDVPGKQTVRVPLVADKAQLPPTLPPANGPDGKPLPAPASAIPLGVNPFVRAIVAGQEQDPDHVDAVLLDAGKTLDDLRQAVELLERRAAMKSQLDTVPKLEAEKADLEAKIGKATEVLNAAEAKYAEMTNPLRWRLEAIKSDIQETWNLPQQLVESCPYLELVERARQIEQAKIEALNEATRLRRQIEEHLVAIREYERQAEQSSHKPHRDDYRERAKHRGTRMAEAQASLTQMLKRIEELEKQEAAIREQMLTP